jgi:predicted RNase H-like nuclease
MLIDIPIGLSSKNFLRTVDTVARTHLSIRKSSIFSPPSREALRAEKYQNALTINKHIEGKGISIQAFNIGNKISEIDAWLDKKRSGLEVLEAHPELCFKTLNQDKDIPHSKHSKEGIDARKEVIFSSEKKLKNVYEDLMKNYKRSEVKADDILDAMALFLINKNSEHLKIISDENNIDETGKKVGIVYG